MEEEGSGQRGRWQWPVPEFEAASPPPPPTPPFSSPPSGAAKAQRGCLQGVHLCTSEHFLLHTCIERHAQISRVETHFFFRQVKADLTVKPLNTSTHITKHQIETLSLTLDPQWEQNTKGVKIVLL